MVPKIAVSTTTMPAEISYPISSSTDSENFEKNRKISHVRKRVDSESENPVNIFHPEENQNNVIWDKQQKIKENDDKRKKEENLDIDSEKEKLLSSNDEEEDLNILLPSTSVKDESSLTIALQVFVPFLIAGLGTVAAGILLDKVQHWKVYVDIPEVFILVPALLGLKGNLEMTLASRLSTAANVGYMDTKKERNKIIIGNMALTQAQALIVAALTAIAAAVFRWVANDTFSIHHVFLLCASSLITAALASAILGGVMVTVIFLSGLYGLNPDNIATPIAASLGDLVTLALLSVFSDFLYQKIGTHHWIAPLICLVIIMLLPIWLYLSHHNKYTHNTLYTGWSPVILAMCISSGGGLILSTIVQKYIGLAVFSPVINGVGGNLVAVQASRIATALHKEVSPGVLPDSTNYGCITTFCKAGGHSRTARVLLTMSIPGHIVFLAIIANTKSGHTSPTARFVCFYLLAGFIQVSILLFLCNWLVHLLWKWKKDPDNYSIPYLTALGDLLGTALLALAFHLLYLLSDRDVDVGE